MNTVVKENFSWIPFYMELADKLLEFKNNRKDLISLIKQVHSVSGISLPKIESNNDNIDDIDPFTVFALFNRGKQSDETRKKLCSSFKSVLGINKNIPNDFDGIPMYNYTQYCFYRYKDDVKRNNACFDILWDLFEKAIGYAADSKKKSNFITSFEKALSLDLVGLSKITIGLFQIRPLAYLNLDSVNSGYISSIMNVEIKALSGAEYLKLCDNVSAHIISTALCRNFAELSAIAYNDKTTIHPIKPQKEFKMNISKNTILYGPPGTGKTYNTVNYAVAIIENKPLEAVQSEEYNSVLERYNKYKSEELIEFTTFHQSYGYEEFIEGIKPVIDSEESEQNSIRYTIEKGIFMDFCEKASIISNTKSNTDFGFNKNPTIWKVSLCSTGDNPVRKECHDNGHIRIGWDEYGGDITENTDFSQLDSGKVVLNTFINQMKIGDIVFSCYTNTTIDAIGVVTGEYEWCGEKYDYYNRKRNVKWIVKDIREDIVDINGGNTMTLASVYRLKNITLSDVMAIIEKYLPKVVVEEKKNRVFIIDEINRGNISKIFGELITLIEPIKRIGQAEGMKVKLPYSAKPFGVPDNVYLLGTMNTADRSIAMLDTALRRRFRFKEIMPDPDVLDGIEVDGIIVKDILEKINKRISALYDREHTIGHAYFMPLKKNMDIETLAMIFSDDIIPLLQEYFYEDYEKIRMVLGDNQKKDTDWQFITKKANNYNELFGNVDDLDETFDYSINNDAFYNIEAYKNI